MKFFVWVAVIVCLALGGAGIFYMGSQDVPKEPVLTQGENNSAAAEDFTPNSFEWEVVPSARYEKAHPWQNVSLIVRDAVGGVRRFSIGEFEGCSQQSQMKLESSEVTRLTCWWGGGGDDISVFLEDNSYALKKRWTSETGNDPNALPRGPWEIITTLGESSVTLERKSKLGYMRDSTHIDAVHRNLGVQLKYEAFPMCDHATTKDVFAVETGDGQTYRADCKGVQDHVYTAQGTFVARYLRNGVLEASVLVDVSKPLAASAPLQLIAEQPKEIPPGSLVYADFWRSASKGTTLEKYVWGASGDDDYYDGGEGTDTLQYFGTRAEHEIVRSPLSPADANSFLLIRRIRDNSMDIVLNIEIFVFADQTVKAEDLFK